MQIYITFAAIHINHTKFTDMQINLDKNVFRCYPGAQLLGVASAYIPGTGWTDTLPSGQNIERPDIDIATQIEQCIRAGATTLNIHLVDGGGVECNPDFSASELTDV